MVWQFSVRDDLAKPELAESVQRPLMALGSTGFTEFLDTLNIWTLLSSKI